MPQRILVIDDSAEIVQLYVDILTDEGYTVVATFAQAPTDAELVAQHQPDLVIMDWYSGLERLGIHAMNMLKSHPSTAALPIIVCTGLQQRWLSEEDKDSLSQRGVGILHKPFAVDDLVAMIEQVFVPKPLLVS